MTLFMPPLPASRALTQVDALKYQGDTKLWDALEMAYSLLKKRSDKWRGVAQKRKNSFECRHDSTSDAAYSTARDRGRGCGVGGGGGGGGECGDDLEDEEPPLLRIVVLSDGKDTKSVVGAHRYARKVASVLRLQL